MKLSKKLVGLGAVALLAVGLAACGGNDDGGKADKDAEKSVGESLNYKITGIDPGAGIMEATEKAIKEYGLEKDWDLTTGSGAAMTAALKKLTIKNNQSL